MIKDKVEHIKALNGMSESEWRFWAKVDTSGDCWEWQGAKTPTGYGMFGLGGKTVQAHRASWFFVFGEVLKSTQHLLHKCDNPGCVNPDHLRIGEAIDNVTDMIAKGRQSLRNGTKLSKIQVNIIRCEYETGAFTQEQLAKRHGVSLRQISNILNNKSWKRGGLYKELLALAQELSK